MNLLTIATLNLEDGEAVELLPELAAQAGSIDLLLFQEGKNWHADGGRTRYRAERLLGSVGLDRSVMTADSSGLGPLHTLIFWNSGKLRLLAHHDPLWEEWTGPSIRGVAEFETASGLVLHAKSVHWAYYGGDARLEAAQKLTWLADPRLASVIAGDCNSLWPDCPGHREFEPGWHKLPAHKRHHKTLPPGARPDGPPVSDRRALTALAEAGFQSAGCIGHDMTPTVNDKADIGQGGRIDHLIASPVLAACIIPGSYRVYVSQVGKRATDHRLVSAQADLDQLAYALAA